MTAPSRPMIPLVFLVPLLLSTPALRADELTGTVVRLSSGRTARYETHFDRNALVDSRLSGDALIALTRSGHLLRFDRATRALTRERLNFPPAACLGGGGAEVTALAADPKRPDGVVAALGARGVVFVQVAKGR